MQKAEILSCSSASGPWWRLQIRYRSSTGELKTYFYACRKNVNDLTSPGLDSTGRDLPIENFWKNVDTPVTLKNISDAADAPIVVPVPAIIKWATFGIA